MTLVTTGFKLPSYVVANGTGVTGWQDPQNILLANSLYAVSGGVTNILEVGGFNFNLPQGVSVTAITLRITGYRGSFNTTLNLYAVDDTSGTAFSYPFTPPFQGFNGVNTTYTLTPSLFATTWTVDQLNNIKLKLIADGELHMDYVEMDVQYSVPATITSTIDYTNLTSGPFTVGEIVTGSASLATATIVTDNGVNTMSVDNIAGTIIIGETITGGTSGATATVSVPTGDVVCHEFVQAQKFTLAQSFVSSDLSCLVTSFNYPDGVTPILIGDFHGDALIVVDQGVPAKEENIRLTNVEHNFQGTGNVKLSFGSQLNRGLKFQSPYTNDPALQYDHSGTAEVVISNSAPFYDRFLKKCQIDALVSAPITVQDEDVDLTNTLHILNFKGNGVTATVDGGDPNQINVNIPGSGTSTPVIVNTSSATSGNVQVPTLTWNHVSSGLNRGILIQISTEQLRTVTGVTYNGIPLAQIVSVTDVPNNLREEQWFLVAPPVGTYPIVVTLSGAAYISAGAETITTVDQATPVGSTQTGAGNSNAPTETITTLYDNSMIFDGLVTAQTPVVYIAGAGQVINWSHTTNTDTRQGASSYEPAGTAPDNVVMDWSITQITPWLVTAVEIKGITSAVSTLTVEDSTVVIDANVDTINFTGSVVVSPGVPGTVNVNISGGSGGNYQVDQTPDNGTYGLLAGAVDGVNTTYTVSLAVYETGKLQVYLNGLIQLQGVADDWVETTPGTGVFDFVTPPVLNDIITVVYLTSAGGSLTLQTNAIANADQTLLNLVAGTNVTLTDNGLGAVTIDAASGATTSVGEQYLSGITTTGGGPTTTFKGMTSTSTGDSLYVASDDGNNDTITRYARDINTGMYYPLEAAGTGAGDGLIGMCVNATFLYVFYRGSGGNNGLLRCDRFLAADLTGGVTMTITGTPNESATNGAFSDGTDLYVGNDAVAGTWDRYTIAGTVLTFASSYTGANASTRAAFYDGGDIYMMDDTTSTVYKYSLGVATFTLVSSQIFAFLLGNTSTSMIGFAQISSLVFYLGYNVFYNDGTAGTPVRFNQPVIKAFSKI